MVSRVMTVLMGPLSDLALALVANGLWFNGSCRMVGRGGNMLFFSSLLQPCPNSDRGGA